ncbi:MAG: hypothetical protein O3C60_09520 [Planctomycetota bacterium]|nr:hypothetical protein [Planctomycetota bacterium]
MISQQNFSVRRFFIATVAVVAIGSTQATAAQFGAVANGLWGVAANWTPAGGPPGTLDDAFIGSNSPVGSAAVATISLGANQTVNDLRLGNSAGNTGTFNLAGFNLTANSILISPFGGTGNVLHNGGRFTTVNLSVHNANALSLSANDVTANLSIRVGAQVNTAAIGNVTSSAAVVDAASLLSLGADFSVAGEIDIRGTAAAVATINANGRNITARNIYIGRFNNAGDIINDGAIVATGSLGVSRGTFTLDANDSVADTVAADSAGTLNLHANTAAKNGNVHSGVRINTVAATNLNTSALVLDQGSLLNLGANLTLTEDIDIRGTGANVATINANDHNITARNIYIGRFNNAGDIINDGAIVATGSLGVSRGTFTLDANDSVADTVAADSAGTLNLHANTAAKNGNVHSGARINTVAATNLSTGALVLDEGSLLNLGANLTLTEDIDIRGNGTSVATINANGRNITARNIYIGRFTHAGDIINDGAIVATGSLGVSRGTFTLDANDSVADTVAADSAGTLNLHANTAAKSVFVGTGATVNTVAATNRIRVRSYSIRGAC